MTTRRLRAPRVYILKFIDADDVYAYYKVGTLILYDNIIFIVKRRVKFRSYIADRGVG